MKMIQLSDGCTVMPTEISEVVLNRDSNRITVRMKSGVGHSVGNAHGEPIYGTYDKLVNAINEALK